jgi:hypothetical protein
VAISRLFLEELGYLNEKKEKDKRDEADDEGRKIDKKLAGKNGKKK